VKSSEIITMKIAFTSRSMAVLRENVLANRRPPMPSLPTTLGDTIAADCFRCRSRRDLRIRHGHAWSTVLVSANASAARLPRRPRPGSTFPSAARQAASSNLPFGNCGSLPPGRARLCTIPAPTRGQRCWLYQTIKVDSGLFSSVIALGMRLNVQLDDIDEPSENGPVNAQGRFN
jgi:hypothetical protein